jgi:cytidine deaminase
MAAAITAGDNDLIAVPIVADRNQPAVPCGARQVLTEINPAVKIIAFTDPEDGSLS